MIPGDYVTTEDGTGIVHIAPTFGADDANVARAAGIPSLFMINKRGETRPMVDLTGKFYKLDELDENFVKERVNVDLYKDELQNNTFTEEELYEINILLGNLIFYLRANRRENLFSIFRVMTICLNSIQGIISLHKDKYVNKKINKHFAKICKNKNISFGKAMMIVLNRSKNFNIKNYVYADNAPYNEVLENGLIGIYYADKYVINEKSI